MKDIKPGALMAHVLNENASVSSSDQMQEAYPELSEQIATFISEPAFANALVANDPRLAIMIAIALAVRLLSDANVPECFGSSGRDIDGKFAINSLGQIFKKSNGEILPEDEPLFVFRARDYLAIPTLEHYLHLSSEDASTEYHIDGLVKQIDAFKEYAKLHSDRMKQPGCTRGK